MTTMPPEALAQFDQAYIETSQMLDAIIAAYDEERVKRGEWEMAFMVLRTYLRDEVSHRDAVSLLAGAIHRLSTQETDDGEA